MHICNECGNVTERKVVCKDCAVIMSRRSFFGLLGAGIISTRFVNIEHDYADKARSTVLDLLDQHIERIRPLMAEVFEDSAIVSGMLSEHNLENTCYAVNGRMYRLPIEVS